jgi:hypothetical protein
MALAKGLKGEQNRVKKTKTPSPWSRALAAKAREKGPKAKT